MAEIIAIANQKGGVAKTTTSLNLAYSLMKLGKKVLMIDFDGQANLTTCFGIEEPNSIETNIAHLMIAKMNEEDIPDKSQYIVSNNGIDLIPSSIYLSVVDANLRLEMGSERILFEILEPLKADYDFIIIDTSPSLGSLTINALSAADSVIITVNPQLLAMMGLQDFLKTTKKIQKRINSKLEIKGILLTMCDSRTNLSKVLSEQMSEAYDGVVNIFETHIPMTVKVGEAIYYSKSIAEYSPTSKAGIAYADFAKEILTYEER
ncbi:Cobyrinic acid a,c-diamide synthase [Alkaliphilus metalliredigens QYMF]|uniref:Sporulation initiation inhibitor protein Soj n=1 Tax=Alkaliphilus metalliredigens (strain QYMF) TaxID=293826 RepID=A6TV58_ALKMQ|nr:AAA family ATPase [Alkaliphilus metalliredigens]ABR50076.1 Cobyrinic acid a,c-diamide synthase [Alkaliphilus metalliredigens QYMF]